MSNLEQVIENLRIPYFFRDILFLLGGAVTIPALFYFHLQLDPKTFYGGIKALVELDSSFTVAIVFLALAYLTGRLNDVVADAFYGVLRFIYKILPFIRANQEGVHFILPWSKSKQYHYGAQLMFAWKELIGIKVRDNLYSKTLLSSNFYRVCLNIGGNRVFADNLERLICSDVIFSQIFILAIFPAYYLSPWFGILCLPIIYKKYSYHNSMQGQMNEVRKEIVRNDKSIEEINKEIAPVVSSQD